MIDVAFKARTKVDKRIKEIKTGAEKAEKATLADFRSRAPGWVAAEVVKTYNIKKSKITPKKGKASKLVGGSRAAAIGKHIGSAALIYHGHVLSPAGFGMTPKTPRETYTLKIEILKGQKKTLGKVRKITKKQRENIGQNYTHQGTRNSPRSPIMLAPVKNKTGEISKYIPFQRVGYERKDVQFLKTLSMPQMVSNPQVAERISERIYEGISKRLEHNIDRYMGK